MARHILIATFFAAKIQVIAAKIQMNRIPPGEIDPAIWIFDHDIVYLAGCPAGNVFFGAGIWKHPRSHGTVQQIAHPKKN